MKLKIKFETWLFSILFVCVNPMVTFSQWLPSNNGMTDTVVYTLEYNYSKTKVFAGTLGSGVFTSVDNGTTWQSSNLGVTNDSIVSMAYDDSLFFVGTHSGLFKSTNDGNTWQLVNQLPSGLTVLSISLNGSEIFIGTDGYGVFYSSDLGNSWNPVNSGLPPAALHVTSVIKLGGNLLIGTVYGGVYKSVNNGSTWFPANNGLSCTTYCRSLVNLGNRIFVGTQGCGVYYTTDMGNTWYPSNSGLTNLTIIKMIATGSDIYAATFGGGICYSVDTGNTWTAKNSGLNSNYELAVNTITTNGNDFIIGTFGAGAFKYQTQTTSNKTLDGSDNKIEIFPNPSIEKIFFNSDFKIESVDLIDNIGNVRRLYPGLKEIDISNFNAGVYELVFYGPQKKVVQTKKIIKQ